MTFTAELSVWLVLVLTGVTFATLSLRRALFVLHAVQVRDALPEVVSDTRHVCWDQLLLMLGWLLFGVVGIVALFTPAAQSPPPPPLTPLAQVVTWGLVGAVGIWATKTTTDYLYTHRLWHRAVSHAP